MTTHRRTLTTTEYSPVVDPEALRAEVRTKYAEVATNPSGHFHFHTGRALAAKLGYPKHICDTLPDSAMASFAGVDNPFAAGPIPPGSRVVDLGSGGGFDCFVAAELVGPTGSVIGVDMTPEMLDRARREAAARTLDRSPDRELSQEGAEPRHAGPRDSGDRQLHRELTAVASHGEELESPVQRGAGPRVEVALEASQMRGAEVDGDDRVR